LYLVRHIGDNGHAMGLPVHAPLPKDIDVTLSYVSNLLPGHFDPPKSQVQFQMYDYLF
jgi:hypothetical protein